MKYHGKEHANVPAPARPRRGARRSRRSTDMSDRCPACRSRLPASDEPVPDPGTHVIRRCLRCGCRFLTEPRPAVLHRGGRPACPCCGGTDVLLGYVCIHAGTAYAQYRCRKCGGGFMVAHGRAPYVPAVRNGGPEAACGGESEEPGGRAAEDGPGTDRDRRGPVQAPSAGGSCTGISSKIDITSGRHNL